MEHIAADESENLYIGSGYLFRFTAGTYERQELDPPTRRWIIIDLSVRNGDLYVAGHLNNDSEHCAVVKYANGLGTPQMLIQGLGKGILGCRGLTVTPDRNGICITGSRSRQQ